MVLTAGADFGVPTALCMRLNVACAATTLKAALDRICAAVEARRAAT